jgi:hypothetical protein
MKKIQVDMFAVGLGASVLTQIALKDETSVTVLSDGGMGRGYPPETVKTKLPEALACFGTSGCARIDLIVGTHYDADHLKGLVPIINDESIEIGEVWLPPVRKDTEEIPGKMETDDFLAELFFDDDDDFTTLKEYLWRKAIRIDELQKMEQKVLDLLQGGTQSNEISFAVETTVETIELGFLHEPDVSNIGAREAFLKFFERHRKAALKRINSKTIHEAAAYDSRYPTAREVLAHNIRWQLLFDEEWEWLLNKKRGYARIMLQGLATIRESEASGAITAVHRQKVVRALHERKSPIRPRCRFVLEGHPAPFVWSANERRFIRSERKVDEELILTLLGPSEKLIEELSTKVPVAEFAYAAILRRDVIPREGITASNQLSYIFTLEMLGQRILITGDAGCYKFRKTRRAKAFHSELLAALKPLHVVQIAHHGGRNNDFYHALIAAGFDQQKERAFLLLSHEIESKHRPSVAFQSFISKLRRGSDEPWLLFTSMPKESKIEEYADLIHSAISTAAQEGDVRLIYDAHDLSWHVDRHSINITRVNLMPRAFSPALERKITVSRPFKLKRAAKKILSRFRNRSKAPPA